MFANCEHSSCGLPHLLANVAATSWFALNSGRCRLNRICGSTSWCTGRWLVVPSPNFVTGLGFLTLELARQIDEIVRNNVDETFRFAVRCVSRSQFQWSRHVCRAKSGLFRRLEIPLVR